MTTTSTFYPSESHRNSLDDVVGKMKDLVQNVDEDLNEKLHGLESDAAKVNPADLANVQHALNKWSITYNLAATTNRTVKDLMSGIIQKI